MGSSLEAGGIFQESASEFDLTLNTFLVAKEELVIKGSFLSLLNGQPQRNGNWAP